MGEVVYARKPVIDHVKNFWPYHFISTLGAYALFVGLLLILINWLHGLFFGKIAPANPWGSNSLEWHTNSPPPTENFTHEVAGVDPYDYDAWHYADRPVLVATHHPLPPAPQGGTAWAVQGPIARLVEEAKAAAGDKDVYLDGGDLVRQGLDAGLVDELCLTFLPLLLGRGIRLWEGLQNRTDLRFDAPTRYGAGMVQITARARGR
jgi:dihydrofolate reductase